MAIFTRNEIEEGLKRLGELAQAKGLHIQLTLVGGAVMVLRFDGVHPPAMWTLLFFNRVKRDWFVIWQNKLQKNSSGQKTG